ncbi:NUDIX hydrolase [Nesterenkonia lutea]|uniref:8-oxo-dGTP diphosphatase n=1 Tax=Nesterenkonia lutea TaxID=272919 RepID=A0ABR9JAR8_9MICC|nr:NUDIX hydrolase [Nesterenkonia lutea]MBE1523030.1 8-oxo-dGTP diphosphatase [Nesterenkonia lutea]
MSSPETMIKVPRRRTVTVSDDGTDAEILAAGALCWRLRRGELEVLLIHRQRYDDWSFPKGKLDEGETLPECAVREVREEIGLKVRLGMPLPITRYSVGKARGNGASRANGGKTKEVWYWAAQVAEGTPVPDGDEVDETVWVDVARAREMLTNRGDVLPLDELESLHEQQRLHTLPFIVLRHAKAKPRSSWSRAESERPLAATGKRQARSVERLLICWRPRHLESSPWKRCEETIAPYVKAHRNRATYRKSLTEKRAEAHPERTRARTRRCLELLLPTLICTHRPVLPLILETMNAWFQTPELGSAMPDEDPYLRPGAVLVAQQAMDRGGEIVALEVYEPFED